MLSKFFDKELFTIYANNVSTTFTYGAILFMLALMLIGGMLEEKYHLVERCRTWLKKRKEEKKAATVTASSKK